MNGAGSRPGLDRAAHSPDRREGGRSQVDLEEGPMAGRVPPPGASILSSGRENPSQAGRSSGGVTPGATPTLNLVLPRICASGVPMSGPAADDREAMVCRLIVPMQRSRVTAISRPSTTPYSSRPARASTIATWPSRWKWAKRGRCRASRSARPSSAPTARGTRRTTGTTPGPSACGGRERSGPRPLHRAGHRSEPYPKASRKSLIETTRPTTTMTPRSSFGESFRPTLAPS